MHQLDQRKKGILKAIVSDYIETAEPVGSKSLVQRYGLTISSATIRNEMAELEEQGYLEKPHTSAGRIPSDKGYRVFVQDLLDYEKVSAVEEKKIRTHLRQNLTEVGSMIKQAADLLAERTNMVSLVLSPKYQDSELKQIKMLMIEPGRALVVVVLAAGIVKDKMVFLPEVIDQEQLFNLANTLEQGLSGKKLEDITLVTVLTSAKPTELPEQVLNQVAYEAYVAIKQAENIDCYIEGTHHLLEHPEFQDVGKVHRYLSMLEKEKIVAGYINELPEAPVYFSQYSPQKREEEMISSRSKFMIRIGQEINLEGFQDCSLVTTSYKVNGNIFGKIGIMGPKRMAYSKIIAQIDFINKTLNEEMAHFSSTHKETKNKTEGDIHGKK